MVIRAVEGVRPAKHPELWRYNWRPLEQISANLQKAVITAEDQKFYQHQGFDFEAIEKAIEHNQKRPKKKKGASTISQQTAKNVFLWPARSWLRKGLEAYFTAMIELMWSKDRIMEVYLNIVEFGPGIYGAEAAAQAFFGKPAARLSASESALLAASLPNPRQLKVNQPGPYMRRRQSRILALMDGRGRGVVESAAADAEQAPDDSARNNTNDSESAEDRTEVQIIDERSGEPLSDGSSEVGEDHQ
jgi:monofunctional biosynthetic peptidoglycan transglycosylase